MLSEDWQIGFKVKGLGAPEKEMVFDDYILIRGVPRSDSSYVFFKVAIQNEKEKDKLRDDSINVLKNIAQMYGLVTNVYTEALLSSVMAKISSEDPFGHTKYPPELGFVAVIEEEQRRNNIPLIKKLWQNMSQSRQSFRTRRRHS